MNSLRRFLAVLAEIAPHLPPTHRLLRIDAARRVLKGENLAGVAGSTGLSERLIERTVAILRRGSLGRLTTGVRRVAPMEAAAHRLRLAQLMLGALTEERFEREKAELTAGHLMVEDHRLGRTDTDYRVLNGSRRPIFRINIKFHGSAFEQARERVGLAPAECFALATYKINQALIRQRDEALPYVFLVLSCLELTARVVGDLIPRDFPWFIGMSVK